MDKGRHRRGWRRARIGIGEGGGLHEDKAWKRDENSVGKCGGVHESRRREQIDSDVVMQ